MNRKRLSSPRAGGLNIVIACWKHSIAGDEFEGHRYLQLSGLGLGGGAQQQRQGQSDC
jgi:hypothetical protein